MPTVAPLAIARLVAATAVACDGVVAVTPGPFGVTATHGVGGRVPGVRVEAGQPGRVALHLSITMGRPIAALAADVRTAVAATLDRDVPDGAPWSVDVHVVDVDAPPVPSLPGRLG